MAALDELRSDIQTRRSLPPPAVRRALREAAGVSRQRLAQALGTSRESVRLWELGTVEPNGKNLRQYLMALELFGEVSRA